MYKTDIVRSVARETRLSHRLVTEVLTGTLDAITQALRDGETVVLPGFGTFYTKERPPSTVKHFRTGAPIAVPALRQADFRAGDLLRRAVRKAPRRRARRETGSMDGTA